VAAALPVGQDDFASEAGGALIHRVAATGLARRMAGAAGALCGGVVVLVVESRFAGETVGGGRSPGAGHA